jgi:DDE superfamily endonuclease
VTLPIKRLWFIDEFGIHLALSRSRARAPRGERAVVVEPFETGGNISVISALTLDGVRAPMMIEGTIDGEVLELYVAHFLGPQLRPGDIVIWDNVPTHKKAKVLALIEAAGAERRAIARIFAGPQPERGVYLQSESRAAAGQGRHSKEIKERFAASVCQSNADRYPRVDAALRLCRPLITQTENA